MAATTVLASEDEEDLDLRALAILCGVEPAPSSSSSLSPSAAGTATGNATPASGDGDGSVADGASIIGGKRARPGQRNPDWDSEIEGGGRGVHIVAFLCVVRALSLGFRGSLKELSEATRMACTTLGKSHRIESEIGPDMGVAACINVLSALGMVRLVSSPQKDGDHQREQALDEKDENADKATKAPTDDTGKKKEEKEKAKSGQLDASKHLAPRYLAFLKEGPGIDYELKHIGKIVTSKLSAVLMGSASANAVNTESKAANTAQIEMVGAMDDVLANLATKFQSLADAHDSLAALRREEADLIKSLCARANIDEQAVHKIVSAHVVDSEDEETDSLHLGKNGQVLYEKASFFMPNSVSIMPKAIERDLMFRAASSSRSPSSQSIIVPGLTGTGSNLSQGIANKAAYSADLTADEVFLSAKIAQAHADLKRARERMNVSGEAGFRAVEAEVQRRKRQKSGPSSSNVAQTNSDEESPDLHLFTTKRDIVPKLKPHPAIQDVAADITSAPFDFSDIVVQFRLQDDEEGGGGTSRSLASPGGSRSRRSSIESGLSRRYSTLSSISVDSGAMVIAGSAGASVGGGQGILPNRLASHHSSGSLGTPGAPGTGTMSPSINAALSVSPTGYSAATATVTSSSDAAGNALPQTVDLPSWRVFDWRNEKGSLEESGEQVEEEKEEEDNRDEAYLKVHESALAEAKDLWEALHEEKKRLKEEERQRRISQTQVNKHRTPRNSGSGGGSGGSLRRRSSASSSGSASGTLAVSVPTVDQLGAAGVKLGEGVATKARGRGRPKKQRTPDGKIVQTPKSPVSSAGSAISTRLSARKQVEANTPISTRSRGTRSASSASPAPAPAPSSLRSKTLTGTSNTGGAAEKKKSIRGPGRPRKHPLPDTPASSSASSAPASKTPGRRSARKR